MPVTRTPHHARALPRPAAALFALAPAASFRPTPEEGDDAPDADAPADARGGIPRDAAEARDLARSLRERLQQSAAETPAPDEGEKS